jgi:hypothetical protein
MTLSILKEVFNLINILLQQGCEFYLQQEGTGTLLQKLLPNFESYQNFCLRDIVTRFTARSVSINEPLLEPISLWLRIR